MASYVAWSRRAETNLDDYLALLDNEGYRNRAKRFYEALQRLLELVAVFPKLFKETDYKTSDGIRLRMFRLSEMSIYYLVDSTVNRVFVVALRFSKEDPSRTQEEIAVT